jgi:hypothetical protein
MSKYRLLVTACIAVVMLASGCATHQSSVASVTPAQLQAIAPQPIEGNSGKFMSPYTTDGVVAEWVDKAVNAKAGSAIGQTVGAYAGAKALEQVPFIGGFLGAKAGKAIGQKIALSAIGGEEFLKSSSDLSFNSVDDLAVYTYVNFGTTEHYGDALKAAMDIYPELKDRNHIAVRNANKLAANVVINEQPAAVIGE